MQNCRVLEAVGGWERNDEGGPGGVGTCQRKGSGVIRGLEEPACRGQSHGGNDGQAPRHRSGKVGRAHGWAEFDPGGTTESHCTYKTKRCPVAWKMSPFQEHFSCEIRGSFLSSAQGHC